MKCPMTFNDPCCDRDEECRPDCAWLLRSSWMDGEEIDTTGRCAIAVLARAQNDLDPESIFMTMPFMEVDE